MYTITLNMVFKGHQTTIGTQGLRTRMSFWNEPQHIHAYIVIPSGCLAFSSQAGLGCIALGKVPLLGLLGSSISFKHSIRHTPLVAGISFVQKIRVNLISYQFTRQKRKPMNVKANFMRQSHSKLCDPSAEALNPGRIKETLIKSSLTGK